jgi:hypothetical protein
MDSAIVVAGITAFPVLVASLAQWADMRRRTNGSSPLAAKLDEHGERLTRIEERTARTEERTARVERYLASEARRWDGPAR